MTRNKNKSQHQEQGERAGKNTRAHGFQYVSIFDQHKKRYHDALQCVHCKETVSPEQMKKHRCTGKSSTAS